MGELKRQTFCIDEDNIEMIRQAAFFENKKKQDIVNDALAEYFKKHHPELYKKIKTEE